MRTTARSLACGAALVAVLAGGSLTGCSNQGDDAAAVGQAITIGSQSGVGNQVVAQLYGQALEAKGYTVDYNYGIGSRTSFLDLLKSGVVDLVPDYAGALLDTVDSEATAASTEQVMTRLPTELEPLGLTVLDASAAQKSRAYVTTRSFASDHELESIADLAAIGPALTFGSAESLATGSHAREALSFSYGVEGWRYRAASDDDEVLDDLRDGTIQVADVSTLHLGAIDDDFVVLSDPQHIVVAQNIVPLVRSAVATDAVSAALDAVSAKLTTANLAAFAETDDALPATTASRWLRREGIVTG